MPEVERLTLIPKRNLDGYRGGIEGELTVDLVDTYPQITLQDPDYSMLAGHAVYDTLVFGGENIVKLRDFLNEAIELLKQRGILK